MRFLFFGTTGQVGHELARHEGPCELIGLGREQADFTQPETITAAIETHAPDGVINAAAYTAVDKAEEEEDWATLINGHTVGVLAEACQQRNIPLVHLSTDYVFPGTGDAPYSNDAPTAPCNAYGRSKRVGEEAFITSGVNGVTLRTSWVFSAHGQNFVKTMLRLAETRDSLTVVADQHGGPTDAAAIAQVCISLAEQLTRQSVAPQIHHFSGQPDTTWADFAIEIFRQWHDLTGKPVPTVSPISSADYPTPAVRPANSRLDCLSLERKFAIKRPDWTQGLAAVLRELAASDKEKDT